MNTSEIIFRDRKEAGQKLAELLKSYTAEKPIILAMPRGGVVVAYEIAQALKAPLDVIVSRKIGAPSQPEYAIGAIAPGDIRVFNDEAISSLDISKTEIETLVAREKKEMERRIKLYRGNKPLLDLKDKVVIIVDDGVATGQTALVAIRSVRKTQPKKIVFACGVCAHDSMELLRQEADEVISLSMPKMFYAVGQWYQSFEQTTDDEVIRLLSKV
ncbi:MAG: phosphoribosyltransferase [uncultured bacterium]|nr:MAG: phosphoribosyltransferase [uncultured bacterium]HBC71209.1 phosphoribosyltransferase [Coxiellaceae bacterium]HBY55992.1 phosphoribosyltransferase [Coxiellaceae bacterium]